MKFTRYLLFISFVGIFSPGIGQELTEDFTIAAQTHFYKGRLDNGATQFSPWYSFYENAYFWYPDDWQPLNLAPAQGSNYLVLLSFVNQVNGENITIPGDAYQGIQFRAGYTYDFEIQAASGHVAEIPANFELQQTWNDSDSRMEIWLGEQGFYQSSSEHGVKIFEETLTDNVWQKFSFNYIVPANKEEYVLLVLTAWQTAIGSEVGAIARFDDLHVYERLPIAPVVESIGATALNARVRAEVQPSNRLEVDNPEEGKIIKAYPNPFYEELQLLYSLPAESEVSIKVHTLNGQLIAQPLSQQKQNAGEQLVTLPLHNIPSGTYIVTIELSGGTSYSYRIQKR